MPTTRPVAPLVTTKGQPLLLTLAARQSETVPHRLKVTLVATTEHGVMVRDPESGKRSVLKSRGDAVALCPEFRLEMS